MRAPASIRDRALALALAMMAVLSACKGRGDAPQAELAPGAVMTYASGGGIAGKTTLVTVFADGRVEGAKSAGMPRPPVRVPVARVEKLATDLAATGVFAQKDGSWTPRRPVPDGFGSKIVLRDKTGAVHAYDSATGATAPDAVVRAMQVGGGFAAEVERENPNPPCACQPGDPLCACPP